MRTLRALQAQGYEGALAPTSALVALGGEPPQRDFAFLVAASSAAFLLPDRGLISRFASTPLRLVGAKTAEAARSIGLGGEAEIFDDASALVAALQGAPTGEALYLAGRSRKPAVEQGFAASGRVFTLVEVYDAVARKSWNEEEINALRECGAFLHYSRRSAQLALRLAEASGLAYVFATGVHVCLSSDIAEALAFAGRSRIVIAKTPDEAALFDALASAQSRA